MQTLRKSNLNEWFKASDLRLTEAVEGSALNERVLAKLSGVIGAYDAASLNERWYSYELWENTIQEVQPRLESGGLFGCCGHDQPFDEKAVATGQFSHKLTKIWLDKKSHAVMGEILILDTDAGRNLNVLLREGLPMGVSTRAYGQAIEGVTAPDGKSEVVDPKTYWLEGLDFVFNMGIPTAKPAVVESHNNTKNEDRTMPDNDLALQNTRLVESRLDAERSLVTAISEKASLEVKNKELSEKLSAVEKALGSKDVVLEAEKLKFYAENHARKWLELEPFKTLAKESGMFDRDGVSMSQVLKTVGLVAESYSKMGSVESISESIKALDAYKAEGTVEEIKAQKVLVKAYAEACDNRAPEKAKKLIENARKVIAMYKKAKSIAEAATIAADYKDVTTKELVVECLTNGVKPEALKKQLKAMRESHKKTQRNQGGLQIVTGRGVKVPTMNRKTDESAPGSFLGDLFEKHKPLETPVVTQDLRRR